MSNTMAQFYAAVSRVEADIAQHLVNKDAGYEHHPATSTRMDPNTHRPVPVVEAVYLTSVDNPLLEEWAAGRVILAPLRLAAVKIVERSHRLSTAAEVEQYTREQREARSRYDAADSRLQSKFTVTVPPEKK